MLLISNLDKLLKMAVEKISNDLADFIAHDRKNIVEFLKDPYTVSGLDDMQDELERIFNKSKESNYLNVQLEVERKREEYRLNNPKYFELQFMKEGCYQYDLGYINAIHENMEKRVKEVNKGLRNLDN
jgi:hypothetical protein